MMRDAKAFYRDEVYPAELRLVNEAYREANWRRCHARPSAFEPWEIETHKPPRKRKRIRRKPTLSGALRQARKAGLEVARYEIDPDGRISVVTGQPEPTSNIAPRNEWDTVQ